MGRKPVKSGRTRCFWPRYGPSDRFDGLQGVLLAVFGVFGRFQGPKNAIVPGRDQKFEKTKNACFGPKTTQNPSKGVQNGFWVDLGRKYFFRFFGECEFFGVDLGRFPGEKGVFVLVAIRTWNDRFDQSLQRWLDGVPPNWLWRKRSKRALQSRDPEATGQGGGEDPPPLEGNFGPSGLCFWVWKIFKKLAPQPESIFLIYYDFSIFLLKILHYTPTLNFRALTRSVRAQIAIHH